MQARLIASVLALIVPREILHLSKSFGYSYCYQYHANCIKGSETVRPIDDILPAWMGTAPKRIRNAWRAIPFRGTGRVCPVCTKSSRVFRTLGKKKNRIEAQCAHCGALERHRLLWAFLERRTTLFDETPKKMLHVAPEECFGTRLQDHPSIDFLSADLFSRRVMVKMDITDIQYSDESFDVIYCSHVLEHVEEDRKAIQEFYRVLKPDGWAILLVPVYGETTYEDASITDPKERLKVFGQEDHVRRYGHDYADRLRESGFLVEVTRAEDLADAAEIQTMGLIGACGEIYYCTKP